MYLSKYLSTCGVCSRRKAAEIIKDGLVKINGHVIDKPNYEVKKNDVVVYRRKKVLPQEYIYILLNKPAGYVTTCSDEKGRKTVLDLIKGATKLRVYPVGRLDYSTTGLLLLTNDGELAQKLSHPKNEVSKKYSVILNRTLEEKDFKRLKKGIKLQDGFVKVDSCFYGKGKEKKNVIIEIHSGKNRVVRRLFEGLGCFIKSLERIGYVGLTKKFIPNKGNWRLLNKREIVKLKKL